MKTIGKLYTVLDVIYKSNARRINLVDCAGTTIMKTVKNPSFSTYKMFLHKGDVLIS